MWIIKSSPVIRANFLHGSTPLYESPLFPVFQRTEQLFAELKIRIYDGKYTSYGKTVSSLFRDIQTIGLSFIREELTGRFNRL